MAQPVPRPDATTRREFAGMISHIDEALEQITQEMATAGLWDNTLLFACSDNGGDVSSGASNFPFRGSKWSPLEGGTRVPAFFFSPSDAILPRVNRGQRSSILVHITDIHPTLLKLAGVELAAEEEAHLDGYDIWPQLVGPALPRAHHTDGGAATSTAEQEDQEAEGVDRSTLHNNADDDDDDNDDDDDMNRSSGQVVAGVRRLRDEVLYNIDPIGVPPPGYAASCERDDFALFASWFPHAALRIRRWKLVWCRDVDAVRSAGGRRAAGAGGGDGGGESVGDHFWLYDMEAEDLSLAEHVDHSAQQPEVLAAMKVRPLPFTQAGQAARDFTVNASLRFASVGSELAHQNNNKQSSLNV